MYVGYQIPEDFSVLTNVKRLTFGDQMRSKGKVGNLG